MTALKMQSAQRGRKRVVPSKLLWPPDGRGRKPPFFFPEWKDFSCNWEGVCYCQLMDVSLSLLPVAELEARHRAAYEAFDSLSDYAAEVRSEVAAYGDSGPGTAWVLPAYAQACKDMDALGAALAEAYAVGPFLPVAEVVEEDLPF
jgi:hypothetical protein